MPENFDEIADDANEWINAVEIEPAQTVATVLSVRLPLEQAQELRALARSRGIKVGTLLRELITQGMEATERRPSPRGFDISTPQVLTGVTLFFDGSPRQVVSPEVSSRWRSQMEVSDIDGNPLQVERVN
jgi:hypothetical protein